MTTVADLEAAGYDTWTPEESTVMSGWTLFAADGFTRRVNCATAAGSPDTSPSTRAALDDWLSQRRGELFVRVTPLLSPETVATIESEWDYRRVDETVVMTAAASASRNTEAADGVTLLPIDSPEFFERINAVNNRGDASKPAWHRLLSRVADRGIGVTIGDVAAGLVVTSGTHAAVYSVGVAPEARRKGHARSLMDAATKWASDQGCDTMFLQVLATNEAALGLYRTLGYTEAYRYSYLVPNGSDP